MKILQVRFKNLNSLYREWGIDFSHSAYLQNGIFAITGPTGAGKTTILDAICLALYGRTPRLNKVTAGSNEIMSRQAYDCHAEVIFETRKGRYRCHWSQKRARKKHDGELQPPRHEISDARTGEVLESKIRDVAAAIEKYTGMNFERFTRSILLAQGEFSAFLKASASERSPILEQITGTEIYSRISTKVHERRARERKKLELDEAGLAELPLLSAEEIQDLQAALEQAKAQEQAVLLDSEHCRLSIHWLEGLQSLQAEISSQAEKVSLARQKQQAFEPEFRQLEGALKAESLEAPYIRLADLREQQERELAKLELFQNERVEQQRQLQELVQGKALQEAAWEQAKATQKAEGEIIQSVQQLDLLINEKISQLQAVEASLKKYEDEQAQSLLRLQKSQAERDQAQTELQAADRYLSAHQQDQALITDFSGLQAQSIQLQAMQEKYAQATLRREEAKIASDAAQVELQQHREQARQQQAQLAEAEKTVHERGTALSSLLQGREPEDWRQDLEAGKYRHQLLSQAATQDEDIRETQAALAALGQRQASLTEERNALDEDIAACTRQHTTQQREVEHLDTAFRLLIRIQDMETERQRLVTGEPCPLCGSSEHPYATGDLPEMSETEKELKAAKEELAEMNRQLQDQKIALATKNSELRQVEQDSDRLQQAIAESTRQYGLLLNSLDIDAAFAESLARIHELLASTQAENQAQQQLIAEASQLEKDLNAAQTNRDTHRSAHSILEAAVHEAERKADTANSNHQYEASTYQTLEEEMNKLLTTLREAVQQYGIDELTPETMDERLEGLSGKRERWQAQQNAKEKQEQQLLACQGHIDQQQALLEQNRHNQQQKSQEHDDLERETQALRQQRAEKYGAKNPEQEAERLEKAVADAEAAFAQARDSLTMAEATFKHLEHDITALEEATRQRTPELSRQEKDFWGQLESHRFPSEAEYLAARLPASQRQALQERYTTLQAELSEAGTVLKTKQDQWDVESAKNMTAEPLETLQASFGALEASRSGLLQQIGSFQAHLDDNEALRQKHQDRMAHLEHLKTELNRWDMLSGLIGSADGSKFRNFAQGLTFEMVLTYANRQLQKMNNRYWLVRDEGQPLELNVIDTFQAGELRSTKNLSGGESFIVSLALALGLSEMASQKVQVDSLFLDEGFGTLDEETLETALNTLACLHQEGKLIGVISHIPALKDRIGTQLRLVPQAGGRSRIDGPGCTGGN